MQNNTESNPPNYTNPQEIQMQPYNPNLNNKPESKYIEQNHEPIDETPSPVGYACHWVIFLLSIFLYIGVWAVDCLVIQKQTSFYYKKAYSVSSALNGYPYSDSTAIFTASQLSEPISAVMSLVYSWVLWKLPLIVFSYQLISQQPSLVTRLVTFLVLIVALLLAIDILLTAFLLDYYNQWIYYAIYLVLTIVVSIINNYKLNKCKQALANTIIPLLTIVILYFIYSFLLPLFYYKVYGGISDVYAQFFLIIYLYPFFDIIFYSLTLYLGTKIQDTYKNFYSMIHFLLIGYGVGMILIVGYTEVEFYYLIGYFIFKNIFVNWILRRWDKIVNNPACLPGWGIIYYVGYFFCFLPLVGVGKLVLSKSFSSYIFALTSTILYGVDNPLYPSKTLTSGTYSSFSVNSQMSGKIYFIAGIIIWIAMTFTQRYPMKKPTLYDLFYYILGIQLFYRGIACSLSLYSLTVDMKNLF